MLLHGQPYGGCAILLRKFLLPFVSLINNVSNHFVSLKIRGVISIYMPSFPLHPYSAYLNTLGELEDFLDSVSYDHVIIADDFNVDFCRDSPVKSLFLDFISSNDLCCVDRAIQNNILLILLMRVMTAIIDHGLIILWLAHQYHLPLPLCHVMILVALSLITILCSFTFNVIFHLVLISPPPLAVLVLILFVIGIRPPLMIFKTILTVLVLFCLLFLPLYLTVVTLTVYIIEQSFISCFIGL